VPLSVRTTCCFSPNSSSGTCPPGWGRTLITAAHLGLRPPSQPLRPPAPAPAPPVSASGSLQELQRAAVLDALRRTHGHKSRAAALLGITRFQLYARLKLAIDVPRE
jgi:DNA-binding NtrC family response regulator